MLAAASQDPYALSLFIDEELLSNNVILLASIFAASSKEDISLTAYYEECGVCHVCIKEILNYFYFSRMA